MLDLLDAVLAVPVTVLMERVLRPAEPEPLPPLMERGKAGPTPTIRRVP